MAALEDQVQRVDDRASSKAEVQRRNSDLIRVYDGLHEDMLEIRRKVYDLGEYIIQAYFGLRFFR
jgi:hypothetical protein